MGLTRQGELLRFTNAFGRFIVAPSRYMHKDLAKLIEMYELMTASAVSRRSAGRPRSPGGWSELRGRPVIGDAHMHLCDHVDHCEWPDRPQCLECEKEFSL